MALYWPKVKKMIPSNWEVCCNPNLRLVIKARGCKVAGQKKDLGITSHAPGSVNSQVNSMLGVAIPNGFSNL
jgi:hypothetical protein